MMTMDEAVLEIERFTPVERVIIIDKILDDTIVHSQEILDVWAKEAGERWSAYKKGSCTLIPYEKVMSKYIKP